MPNKSAGILLYRFREKQIEVFLVHPGGPFWAKKDLGAWSVPKGEFEPHENPLEAAKREFKEETGFEVSGNFIELTSVKQKSGKLIYVWASEGDFNPEEINSNLFEMEWPPKSGKRQAFPEVDKAMWFNVEEAKQKINAGQVPLILELEKNFSDHY